MFIFKFDAGKVLNQFKYLLSSSISSPWTSKTRKRVYFGQSESTKIHADNHAHLPFKSLLPCPSGRVHARRKRAYCRETFYLCIQSPPIINALPV